MHTVRPGAAGHLLAERHRLGLDHRDEMWEGELHVVPPASMGHQELAGRLHLAWHPHAEAAGLRIAAEAGVFDPATPPDDASSYRVPDLVVYGAEARSDRGVEGAARLVVEVLSPGDESLVKVPWYGSVGVGEVLLIDPTTAEIRRWARLPGQGSGRLVEVGPDSDGWYALAALPLGLRTEAAILRQRDASGAEALLWPM